MIDNQLSETPLLTVVTVCLNRVDTIAAAIESVRGQQAPDVEHLIIDGVSTDGTLDVIARYLGVRVVSEPDTGLYDAMNKGARLARGRYVFFLNSDDELADGVVTAVRAHMQAGVDAVCVGTDFRRRRPDGGIEVIETIIAPEAIVLSPVTATLGSPLLNAKFLRRAFLLDAVGLFDTRYRLASDVDLLLRAALARPRVAVLPIVGHHYLEHAGSLTINQANNNGRRAAEECVEIANVKLGEPGVPLHVRVLLRALRGGKVLAISRMDRRAPGCAPNRSRAFMLSYDVASFSWFLLRYKLGLLRW